MTPDQMKEYQHRYWIGIKSDPMRHAKLLERRRRYYLNAKQKKQENARRKMERLVSGERQWLHRISNQE